MPRSLRVAPQYIEQVKLAVRRNGYPRQKDLAEELGIALATLSNFLNGRPVDYLNFDEICHKLGLNIEEIADFEDNDQSSHTSNIENLPEDEVEFPNYIERPPIENNCYKNITQPGSLLRIKAPKRMGKTLLIKNIINYFKKLKYKTVGITMHIADRKNLSNINLFLQWFCNIVCKELELEDKLDKYWNEDCGINYSCNIYFEEYLLTKINSSIVLALDDVDVLFSYPHIAEDFFTLLRVWNEEAKSRKIWKKLRLVLAYSTDKYIQLDLNHSPFPIGIRIELRDFNQAEVKDLAKRHKLDWDDVEIEKLMKLVGGHPYLVQQAITYCLNHNKINFDELLETASKEIYQEHLQRYSLIFEKNSNLANAMGHVIKAYNNNSNSNSNSNSNIKPSPENRFELESLGLIKIEGNNIQPRYKLYVDYFHYLCSNFIDNKN